MLTEDPMMRKTLMVYVLDVHDCDIKPGTVLGLGGLAQMVCTATNKWPRVFTSKSLNTHHPLRGDAAPGPCSRNSPF